MDRVTIFLIFLCIALLISSSNGFDATQPNSFDVITNGAVGDGITDDSAAFWKTWEAVCGADGSDTPTLIVPSGKTFLLKPVGFYGPCKVHNINVEVYGYRVAPDSISGYEGHTNEWLSFNYIEGLNIYGTGQIDGRGSVWWWPQSTEMSNQERPTALVFHSCNGLQLSGLKHLNSPRNHISINGCNGVTISYVNIIAPENSPNTDGIDIASSTQVLIHDSYIGTGDDCVAINGGTSFINITKVTCGPGHGISVGSLGANGAHETVEEVHVKDCTFIGTMNGARIKTWQSGSGYARKISFEQITLSAVNNPIVIDQYYPNYLQDGSDIEVSDIKYIGVQGTTTAENAITLKCSNSMGCYNIEMTQINITSTVPGKETYSLCINAHGTATNCNPPLINKVDAMMYVRGLSSERVRAHMAWAVEIIQLRSNGLDSKMEESICWEQEICFAVGTDFYASGFSASQKAF
ncbi:probable polygalacturonase At3g15720 [Telopea speciosissima]|uniref:probable polygalacturonase At3g15720 n=1 Tax=Telopea speciosissima TaxID=54955 RepID=UPI001CC779FE|nr:probable polygalacturonase At3g15720 [Telopea speciosissima]